MENKEKKDLTFKQLIDAIDFHYKEMIYYSELKGEKILDRLNILQKKLQGITKEEEVYIRKWIENDLTDDEIIEGVYEERYFRRSHAEEANTDVSFKRKK